MAEDSELLRLRDGERRADALRLTRHAQEAARYRGVAWSGMGPDPAPPACAERQASTAQHRLDRLIAWRASPAGRLLAAVAEAQAAGERLRAAIARDGSVSSELQRQAAILADCAARAVDAAAACGQSAGACATNIASSSPSTASPRNSAS